MPQRQPAGPGPTRLSPVGLSTAASIEPDPDRRPALVLGWDPRPDFVSVNLHEPGSTELVRAAASAGIGVEASVWNAMSARRGGGRAPVDPA